MTPVRGVEEKNVGPVTWREPAHVFEAEYVGGVGRAGTQSLCWREPEAIGESVRTVLEKARTEEEREEGRELLRRAFEKTGQLAEAEEFL